MKSFFFCSRAGSREVVGARRDGGGSLRVVLREESRVVEAMQLVAADLHLLPPFQQGRLGDVGVAEAVAVAVGILLHGALQRLGNADIVNYQSALLARKHTVHAGDGLHQIVAAHGLIDVHRGQRGHVEARQPHVSDDGYLHRVVVVLELAGQLLLVGFVANDLLPVFGVLVRTAHHHLHFLRPPGAELQYLAIDLDGDGAGQRHDHRLARQLLSAVVLVVVDNIPCQRVDSGVFAQQHLQPAVLLLGLSDLLLGGALVAEVVKLVVEQLHRVVVEAEVHHAALVIDGARGAVVHGLAHVVDVDVVAEHLLRVPVAVADGRARESDKRSARQGLSHLLAESLLHALALRVPVLIAILRAVGLVAHHDDVAAGGEGRVALLKLLYGGEDDASALAALQQAAQVVAALGVDGLLAEEVLAAAELAEELVVEVLAVGHDHDRHLGQSLHQLVGVEDHREALARALRVPEHADLAVALHGLLRALQGLAHGVVLMIGGQYLGVSALVLVEADVVLQNVEQPLLLKHAEEEGAVVGDEGRFIRAVHGLPLHVAGLLGGDGAGAGLAHVADYVEGVVAEEAWNALLIVLDLLVGIVDGGVFGDGAFQLHHHEGQSVDHHHHVAALVLILFHAPLVHHLEEVSFAAFVVDEPHQGRPLLAVLQVADLQPVLHPEGKLLVVLF